MPLFTSANAREMAARAVQARRERASARQILAALPPVPTDMLTDGLTEYVRQQVARVRAHLDRVDEYLAKARDARSIESLARARGSLADQERIARGQPLPGAYRPDKQRVAKPSSVEPL